MKSRVVLCLLCCSLFCLAFLYLYANNRGRLSNTVFFGGDSWNYQGLAVNLALGYGYREGGVAPFETYKFDPDRSKNRYDALHYPVGEAPATYYEYFTRGGRYLFYRTPGYPFFLAAVYKTFGIYPRTVKIIQIIFLALFASSLPWIAHYYWGKTGILSGVLSSLFFLRYFCPDPTEIMSESLIVFGLFLWVLFLIIWEKEPSLHRIFWLGVVSAAIVLIKGSNILIPPFFFLYLLLVFRNLKKAFLSAAAFLAGMLLLIAPWSAYATSKSGSFVLLSTHQRTLLLDSNNEDCIQDGAWHPDWRKWKAGNTDYLYNRLKNPNASSWTKVFLFFAQNTEHLPKLFFNKLARALPITTNRWILLTLLGMVFHYINRLYFRNKTGKLAIFPILYFLNLLLITLIFYGSARLSQPFLAFFAVPAIHSVVWTAGHAIGKFRK